MFPVVINSVTVDCQSPETLADFYQRLLGWETVSESDDFVSLSTPGFPVRLGFQLNVDYVPPVWPEQAGLQQQMEHLDFKAANREEMRALMKHALACGARIADDQFSEDWVVMIDPEGHPFCIDTLLNGGK